ncbi:hypothetical protein VE00_10394 [Pseudogymnoascus sp. WSF 3629]|nr:hypothetical protein VE00_10394 [Pseudogymnoascus sp. WSF 3629]
MPLYPTVLVLFPQQNECLARWFDKEVMTLLLDSRGDDVTITDKVMMAAARNCYNNNETVTLLLNRQGENIKITERTFHTIAETFDLEMMALFLNRQGYNIKITEGMVRIIASAMLEVLEFGSKVEPQDNEYCVQASLNILTSLTQEIAHGARGVKTGDSAALAALPVFISHCVYKAAMVCLRDTKVSKDGNLKLKIQPLKDLLGYIGLRWGAARYYAEKIEEEEKINL